MPAYHLNTGKTYIFNFLYNVILVICLLKNAKLFQFKTAPYKNC